MFRLLLLTFCLVAISTRFAGATDAESAQATMKAWEDLSKLTRGDLAFFFDRIYRDADGWEFKQSASVRGMLWRIRKNSSDITGACQPGQVLNVLPGFSLIIKRKAFRSVRVLQFR